LAAALTPEEVERGYNNRAAVPDHPRWLAHYPREQLLVLRFEDLHRGALDVLNRALAFVDLPPLAHARLEPRNTRSYPPLDARTAQRLRQYFEPHNGRLEQLLDLRLGW